MKFIIFIFVILLVACNNNKQESNDLRVIDVASALNKSRTVNLSEVASSIEYIPLETSRESISEVFLDRVYLVNGLLYIYVKGEIVKIFNKNGEYLSTFNKKGRGSEEYEVVQLIDINQNTGNIYIQAIRRILEYNSNGDFIRTINFPKNSESDNLKLLRFTNFSKYFLIPLVIDQSTKYLAVIIDSTSKIVKKIEFPKDELEYIKKSARPEPLIVHRIFKHGNKIRIIFGHNTNILTINEDLSIDTAFVFNFGKYDPKKVVKTQINQDSPYLWQRLGIFESNDYLFLMMHVGPLLRKSTIKLTPRGKEYNYNHACSFFNKKTGKFIFLDQPLPYQIGFYEDFEGGPAFWPLYISQDDYMVSYIDALKFIQYAQTHKVSDKFKKIADSLKEDDNPVVVLVKLKK